MGQLRHFVTPLHQASQRDVLARMLDDKVHCMAVAKQYGQAYWDGERRYGYGGYAYIPGRWRPVAQALIDTYQLGPGSRVLDVGCGHAGGAGGARGADRRGHQQAGTPGGAAA